MKPTYQTLFHPGRILGVLIAACLLLAAKTGCAQTKKSSATFHLGGATTNTLYVNSNTLSLCAFGPTTNIRKSTLNAVLDWNGDYKSASPTTAYTVTLTIMAYSTFSTTTGLLATFTNTLTVLTGSPQAYVSLDVTGLYPSVNRYDVSAVMARSAGSALADVERVITTDVYYTEEFDYNVNNGIGTTMISLSPVTFTNNLATFSWGTNCVNTPNYQLQLLRLYNTDPSTVSSESVITTDIDWNRALTIETGNSLNQLSLTIAEGTGYYAWRVRPIGNAYEGGIANDRNWGLWSDAGSLTQGATAVGISADISPYLFFYNQFDADRNWIFTRNFVEGDATTGGQVNIGEAINYANGLQMAQQQQVRMVSKEKTLVNQTVYDYCGRASLNTLPAPIDRNSLGYIASYVKNTSGQAYSAADFDAASTYSAPAVMDSAVAAGGLVSPSQYYSANNSNETDIPTAAGFPYTRTLFSKDGLNKPLEKSSPGYTHRITTTNKHTARTLYSGIADIEMVRVFGDEALYENSVYKTLNTDANGQTSVSYTSKDGKTLATCLSTPTVSNLDPIPSSTLAAFTVTSNINNNNAADGPYGYRSFKSIAVAEPTTISLGYSLTPNTYSNSCRSFCATCDYKLTLQVTDNNDPDAAPVFQYTTAIASASATSGCSGTLVAQTPTVSLQPGAYTVERIIEANNTYTASPTNNTYINDYIQQMQSMLYTSLTTGTGTLVSDAGVPLLDGGGHTFTVSMTSIGSYLDAGDLDGLYTYMGVDDADTHKRIQLGCDTIRLPVWHCTARTCTDNDMGFERYLYNWYRSRHPTPSVTNQQILDLMLNTGSARTYSYSVNELDTVVNNMIHCGGYDCQKLWDCWQTTVAAFDAASLQNTSYADPVAGTTQSFSNDYLDMFLSCAGYSIQAITTTSWTGQGCTTLGYKSHPYACFNYANPCTACEQIWCRGAGTGVNSYTVNCPSCTGGPPCTSFASIFSSATPTVLTYTATNNAGSVTTTTNTTHNAFYNCYLHTTNCNQGNTAPTDSYTNTINGIVDHCKDMCEARFGSFLSQVTTAYHNIPSQVEGDPYVLVSDAEFGGYTFGTTTFTGTPDVSLATVYCQATGLLNSCLSTCSISIQPDGSLGSSAEIQAIANVLSGRYVIGFEDGSGNCASGLQAASTDGADVIDFYLRALNHQVGVIRDTVSSNGVYWDYRAFLTQLDANATSLCDAYNVYIHPDIPSYFTKKSNGAGCYKLGYVFNSNVDENGTIVPKALYSTSLISSTATFSYSSTATLTAQSANTLTPVAYVFTSSFSPVITGTVSAPAITLLQDALNGAGAVPVTATTVVNSYSNTVYPMLASWTQTLCAAVNLCRKTATCTPLCYSVSPMAAPSNTAEVVTYTALGCAAQTTKDIRNSLDNQVAMLIAGAGDSLRSAYKLQCVKNLADNYTMSYDLHYHHYTLYYYDRAGNLTKTVPPKGVESNTVALTSRSAHPNYSYVTEYEYNSLGQLVRQKTPDGGETTFQYDVKGKLRFSQNAKQLAASKNSYTKYDELARIVEVGEIAATPTYTDLNTLGYPAAGAGADITQTVYSASTSVSYFGNKPQRYLQNRVSYSLTDKDGNTATTGDQVMTCYSYDPHGNVEWLTQDIPELGRSYIGYDYDLVSGSVVQVRYNEEFPDRFYHRYAYDTDKRLQSVETSRDGFFWETDGTYSYYLHGPLKRLLIGRDQVQGLDYTYTIHGWLKSMNHLSPIADPGGDGGLGGDNAYVAKDAYGMVLGYYAGDYVNKTSFLNAAPSNSLHLQGTSLYNGNISSWFQNYDNSITSGLSGVVFSSSATGRTFKYDQLNRITAAQTNTFSSSSVWSTVNDFKEGFAYDPNGNITQLFRNGNSSTGLGMDSLTYRYTAGINQLLSVHDQTTTTGTYSTDLDNQAGTNYTYDAIGNLTADASGSNSITAIDWNVYGKIASLTKSDGTAISYLYDASGNRVYKKVAAAATPTAETTTYYVKDASGNSMAVYDRTNTGSSPTYTATYTLREEPIYGSERLGTRTDAIAHTAAYTTSTSPAPVTSPQAYHNSAYADLLMPMLNNTSRQLFIENINTANTATATIDVGAAEHVLNMTALTTNTAVTFSGARANAAVFDATGRTLLSAWSYSSSAGGTVPQGMKLYLRDDTPITLPAGMADSLDINGQCGFIKKPGTSDEYYFFTFGLHGRAYYHTIDAAAGIVADYNNPVDTGRTFGSSMALLDDRVGQGPSMLYLKSFDASNTYVQPYSITASGISALPSVTVSASDPAYAATGDLQLSAGDTLLAVGTHLSGQGRTHLYKLSADHQTLSATGVLVYGSGNYCKSAEFGPSDKYLFFTQDDGGGTVSMKRVAVSSFTSAAVTVSTSAAQTMDSRTGMSLVSAIRRGSNNYLYYITNTGGTTIDLRMFAAPEATAIATASVNASTNISGLSSGNFPVRTHVLDYALPGATVVASARALGYKEYELKDHLGNVHMTVLDYKVPFTGTSDVKYDERFDDGSTGSAAGSFTVTAGSPTVTAVSNPDTRLLVTGTNGSTVNNVITLATGHKYFIGFDYTAGNCAKASYSLTNLSLGGVLQTDGHTELIADIGAGTNVNLQFSCLDAAASRSFYIDNILIKDLGTSIAVQTNTVLNEGFSGAGYPWVASHSSITYTAGVMRVSGTTGTAPYNVSRGMGLLPGQIYKVRLDVGSSPSLAGGSLTFGFDSNDNTSDEDFTKSIGTSAGTYTFYVVPKTAESTFYINLEGASGSFSFDIDNFIVEIGQLNPKPLYTAVMHDMTDYYAFGAPMPGRSYHVSVPNKYRYGFNGKENDADIASTGDGAQDYGMRIYNPSLGKFLSMDPLIKKYAMLTPYQFASNTPIQAIDLDGKEAFFIHGTTSSPGRWLESPSAIRILAGLTNNKSVNIMFSWEEADHILNDKEARKYAAQKLALYVLNNRKPGEEITLIGHTIIRVAAVKGYPAIELTGFIEFEDFIFFCVWFSEETALPKNIRKLERLLKTILPIKVDK